MAATVKTNPLAKHHPLVKPILSTIKRADAVLVPPLNLSTLPSDRGTAEDWAIEFHEWLSLVVLGSRRVKANDEIDPYLCRYSVPDKEAATPKKLVHLQWSGFMPAHWIRSLFLELM